jgi:hypothetical protein
LGACGLSNAGDKVSSRLVDRFGEPGCSGDNRRASKARCSGGSVASVASN